MVRYWGPVRRIALVVRLVLGWCPLARRSDRAEAGLLGVLAVLVLAALPLGAVVGGRVVATEDRIAAYQQATRHPATAVLLADAPADAALAGDGLGAPRIPVPARWSTPAGDRVGTVPAEPGKRAGSTVPIWVDRSGRRVARPASRLDATVNAVTTGLGVPILTLLAAGAALTAVRRLLDRARIGAWEREWARIGPRWTQRAG